MLSVPDYHTLAADLPPAPVSKPKSLFRFLTDRGGLKPCGDLKYILDGSHGWMVRRRGMTLDRAREACVDAGYLQDAGLDNERESDSTINDLLELIAAEAAGHKQYPYWGAAGGLASAGPSPLPAQGLRGHPGGVTMTRKEYLAAIEKLGLSIVGAGRVLGVSERQAQRIAAGHSAVPEPVAKLLRVMLRLKLSPGDVE